MRVRYSFHETRQGAPYAIVGILGEEERIPLEQVEEALRDALSAPDLRVVVMRGHTFEGPPDLEPEAALVAPDKLEHHPTSTQVDVDL
jgi:hypothetical protein